MKAPNMKLSTLEADLIGDMAQDDYDLWEIYQFVRHHYPKSSEEDVIAKGRNLLAEWSHRGWIEAYQNDVEKTPIRGEALLRLVDELGRQAGSPADRSLRVSLTGRAYEDVDWLPKQHS